MAAARRRAWMVLPLVSPLLMLAACNQADETAAPAGKRAAGEVLGGTINDEMIPLDQLRSQSPPMRVAPSEGGDADAAADGDESSSAPAAPAPTADEPASDESESNGPAGEGSEG